MPEPKILTLDIERLPGLAFVWRTGEQHVSVDMMREPSRTVCWAAKWNGEKGVKFGAEWAGSEFLVPLYELMAEADAVVSFNGDSFDLNHLRGEAVRRGYPPPAPIRSIDLYRTVRRLNYDSGKLAWVMPLLNIGRKVATGGMELWHRVYDGDPAAQATMRKYNIGDVIGTEKLYNKLRPYISDHPALNGTNCPACGSNATQHRGHNLSRMYKTERFQCQSCGHWYTGKKTKIT